MSDAPLVRWLRREFTAINSALEAAPVADPDLAERRALIDRLLAGASQLPPLPDRDVAEDDVLRVHLGVALLHAACARHGVAPDDPRQRPVVSWLLEAQRRWQVAPRLIAAPYLVLNDAEDGWPLTFLGSEDERRFIDANTAGLVVYEQAWTLVQRMRALSLTHPATSGMIEELARVLARLCGIHGRLQASLDHDAYYLHLRHYYEGVIVNGRAWSGVNAGDQGWSMALDLALGLAQGHPGYLAYLHGRLPYLPPSHRVLVERELHGRGWMPALERAVAAVPWGRTLARAAVGAFDAHVAATWAHLDLAVSFVDTGLGTSGTELRFLEETVRMRRDHPAIARLRLVAHG
ncbi:MAG: DUF1864 family protein [Acidobacteria bacterium]|nr:DUF1864 family protein [Acidobacteriota bacterium]